MRTTPSGLTTNQQYDPIEGASEANKTQGDSNDGSL
jgi:hypothetical protein